METTWDGVCKAEGLGITVGKGANPQGWEWAVPGLWQGVLSVQLAPGTNEVPLPVWEHCEAMGSRLSWPWAASPSCDPADSWHCSMRGLCCQSCPCPCGPQWG